MQLYNSSSELSIASPIRIDMTLRREQDRLEQACVFVLDITEAFKRTQFVLLHQKGDVLEQVNVSQGRRIENQHGIMKVTGYNNGLENLRPGSSQCYVPTLPENYHKALIAGERYRLIWPGEEIPIWDWGTKRD
jgi:hypothetical protein